MLKSKAIYFTLSLIIKKCDILAKAKNTPYTLKYKKKTKYDPIYGV